MAVSGGWSNTLIQIGRSQQEDFKVNRRLIILNLVIPDFSATSKSKFVIILYVNIF